MPPSTSDPEKYSLDEMMERLKGKASDDPANGELVTREDGSQAVRVRKRKRRTDQPKREEAKRHRRTRAIQVGVLLVGLIGFTLVIGGVFLYTNTVSFRNKLSDAVSQTLGADVDFKMFRVTPVSANAEQVSLTWQDGGFLKQVKLRHLSAKISPRTLFGQSLTGDEIIAREGEILLQPPGAGRPPSATGGIPVSFGRTAVTKLDVVFGEPTAAAFKLTGTEGTLNLVPKKSWLTLNLHRGSLAIHDWPALKVDRALIDIRATEAEVLTLRITDSLANQGQMQVSGTINTQSPDDLSTLNVKLTTFNLADLLGPEIGKLLNLRIDSREAANSNYLALTSGAPGDAELAVSFSNSLAAASTLTGLHFLAFIARTVGDDPYYEKPEFDDLTGNLRRKGGRIDLTDLHLERKSQLCIKGDLSVAADKALSGTLRVGLPASVIGLARDTKNPGVESKLETMFGPVSNGFRWVTIELGGSLAVPTDDFAKIYNATTAAPIAPSAQPPDPAAPDAGPVNPADPGSAFEDLTTPPGNR